ncbi:uncharacterized protein LOC142589927 isoform X1 [Dermacentor variabilis]|uniref:uncharacterized protein LOC142589927 isoform X1 n=1 Tax=Dermacentor variabilis TaxID=34621 RepID=UPI003F5CADAF
MNLNSCWTLETAHSAGPQGRDAVKNMNLPAILHVAFFIAAVPAVTFARNFGVKGSQGVAYSGEVAGGPDGLGGGYGPHNLENVYMTPMAGFLPQRLRNPYGRQQGYQSLDQHGSLNNYALGSALLRASNGLANHGGPVTGGSAYGGPSYNHGYPGLDAHGVAGLAYRNNFHLGAGQGTGGSSVVMPGYDPSGDSARVNYLDNEDMLIKGRGRSSSRRKRSLRGWEPEYGGIKSGVQVAEGSSRKFKAYSGPQNGGEQGIVLGQLKGCPGKTPIRLSFGR